MSKIITTTNRNNAHINYKYKDIPDECPFCHSSIEPIIIAAYMDAEDDAEIARTLSRVIYQCPKDNCRNVFIGQYIFTQFVRDLYFDLRRIYPVFPKERTFDNVIKELSKDFVEIYNQAYKAEQYGFILIAGPGYRKALEFLIKDYAIKNFDESKKDSIISKPLGKVIDEFIDDHRIQSMAKRAAWLGNDETHYIRKWVDKDIEALKTLIELTVRWIEMVELSKGYESDMPD